MFGFDTVMYILWIASMIYGGVSYAQNAAKAREAKARAIKEYYQALQKGKTQSTVFKAAQASAKTAKENATKYTVASEQLQEEASAREQQTRPDAYTGHRPKTTSQRLKDYGNKYAAKDAQAEDGKTEEDLLMIHLRMPLLSKQDFTKVNFMQYNFNVENFNNNLAKEA